MTTLDVLVDDAMFGKEIRVGTLTRTSSRTGDAVDFEYDPGWLDRDANPRRFALDLGLPLSMGKHFARTGAAELTAAFRDCAPDRWGTILMKRREAIEAREENRKPRLLRAWGYLVGVSDEGRMGAIRLRERGVLPDQGRPGDAHRRRDRRHRRHMGARRQKRRSVRGRDRGDARRHRS